MAYSPTLTAFAQSVYLAVRNRYLDDIEDDDGQLYISQVIDWTNQYLDELETTLDPSGLPVYWSWLRHPGEVLATVSYHDSEIVLPDPSRQLVVTEDRPLLITKDGKTVSRWSLVDANQLRQGRPSRQGNFAARVNEKVLFSREINQHEDGGTVSCDVTFPIPRLSESDETVLTLVKPKQLLVLGVAKNSSLPDIVQGGLSPSFVQKYNDLLQSAIAFNRVTSQPDGEHRENYGYIGGIGF